MEMPDDILNIIFKEFLHDDMKLYFLCRLVSKEFNLLVKDLLIWNLSPEFSMRYISDPVYNRKVHSITNTKEQLWLNITDITLPLDYKRYDQYHVMNDVNTIFFIRSFPDSTEAQKLDKVQHVFIIGSVHNETISFNQLKSCKTLATCNTKDFAQINMPKLETLITAYFGYISPKQYFFLENKIKHLFVHNIFPYTEEQIRSPVPFEIDFDSINQYRKELGKDIINKLPSSKNDVRRLRWFYHYDYIYSEMLSTSHINH